MDAATAHMININAPCALRTHRRTWGLSQQELADLLGMESRTHISRIEHGKRTPTMETALACSTLFGVPLGILFPQTAVQIEERLRERLSRFEGMLKTTTLAEERKRDLCARALAGIDEEAYLALA